MYFVLDIGGNVKLFYIKKRSQLLLFILLNTTHLVDGFGESRNGLE